MDAVEFIKEYRRMIKATKCEIVILHEGNAPASIVSEVDEWAKEHPVKTRQSEFLKMFPSASIDAGAVCICPKTVAPETYAASDGRGCIHVRNGVKCSTCRRDFWLAEISEGNACE